MGNCGIEVFSTYVGGIVGITSNAISMRKSSKKLVGLLLKCNILLQTLTSDEELIYVKKCCQSSHSKMVDCIY